MSEQVRKEQDALTDIILSYLKVTKLRYVHLKEVFCLVSNRVFDKEAESR